MPELPEVETVKRTLNELVAGKRIERMTITLPRILQRPAEPEHSLTCLSAVRFSRLSAEGNF